MQMPPSHAREGLPPGDKPGVTAAATARPRG
jgi:hypothetical protein